MSRVRRYLLAFAVSAPATAVLTYLALLAVQPPLASSASSMTGLALLFSAGTFVYVATVHVLPELTAKGSDRMPRPSLLAVVVGTLLPIVLALGHHH